jgi:hypothetical protein
LSAAFFAASAARAALILPQWYLHSTQGGKPHSTHSRCRQHSTAHAANHAAQSADDAAPHL